MSSEKVTCLCPTYHARPASLVGNSIACFCAQTYRDAFLLVYDDTGHFWSDRGPQWLLVSNAERERHASLGAKYNHMAFNLASRDTDIFVVWEDDDIYLPWHVEACVKALERPGAMWCHPSKVLSLYTGEPVEEGAAGRFHASLAFRREALAQVGGWPNTARGDFDQQLIANLRAKFGPPADPLDAFPPSYVFRWGSTGTRHGQTFMQSGADEEWYERAGKQPRPEGSREVVPAMDAETARLVEEMSKGLSV